MAARTEYQGHVMMFRIGLADTARKEALPPLPAGRKICKGMFRVLDYTFLFPLHNFEQETR